MEQSKFYQIKNVTEHEYTLVGCDGSVITRPTQDVDKSASAFTIQDAKDGDVLADGNLPFIFKKIDTNKNSYAYCGISVDDGFKIESDGKFGEWTWMQDIKPATKKQRDLLFQKMKEAGYEWDADKKELKKIDNEEVNGEDYGIDSLWHAQRILEKTLGSVDGYQSDDGILEHKCAISAVKKLYEQKPAWSEEDKEMYKKVETAIDSYYAPFSTDAEEMSNWLKNLKGRVLPQNNVTDKELAQAKKDAYNDALNKIEYHSGEPTFDDGWSAAIWYLKKRNARPQSQWMPSVEQMDTLKSSTYCQNKQMSKVLFELYQDLKKLREE